MPVDIHLPVSVSVERFVLGSLLLDDSFYLDTANSLEVNNFSLESHRRIYKRMAGIYERGEKIDRITVTNELMKFGELESCGGLSYLVSLDDGLPQIPNISEYVKILKEKALRRSIIFAAQHLMNRAMAEDEPVDSILSGFGETAVSLSATNKEARPVSTVELVETIGVDALLSPRRHGEIRLPWSRLDHALSGVSGGQVIVLLGETSRGKTSFALQAAAHVGHQGKSVLIWTMEMSPRSLFRRLVTQLSGVPVGGKSSENMLFEERDRHRMAVARLTENPIYFDNFSRSVSSFCTSVRQVQAKGPLGFVVVDYLQLIRASSKQNRTQQVSENSRNIKLAAVDFNLPIMVLSQVDRASVKGDGEIGLHSAKEAGDIENDADVLLWIKAKELSREENTQVTIQIGKQREGPAGFGIPMAFRPISQTFLEVTGEDF